MIDFNVDVKIPFLWGHQAFKKNEWNSINLLVGPNGSGKTILSEHIFNLLKEQGFEPEFLRAERLMTSSDSENNITEVFSILHDFPEVKAKVEHILSAMFRKTISLEEKNGKIIPMVTDIARKAEYGFKDGECHGLKEITRLLTALYDCRCKSLILDEPELHLHPQFQAFFMGEIRKLAGDPRVDPCKKMFFLITHSPYFIELRSPDDFRGIVLCHTIGVPTHADKLGADDLQLMKRFLPRFNTHHKQFFFSDNPVFVEGYTDQQILALLLDWLPVNLEHPGSGIIDVGGKDELGVFYRICGMLGTEARIIADLDALFRGKLKEVLCKDRRPNIWLKKNIPFFLKNSTEKILKKGKLEIEKLKEKDIDSKNNCKVCETFNSYATIKSQKLAKLQEITLEDLIARLDSVLVSYGEALKEITPSDKTTPEINELTEKVRFFYNSRDKVEDLDTFKTVVLQGLENLQNELTSVLPHRLSQKLPGVLVLKNTILRAAEEARIYILPRGCIEHYYTQNKVGYMPLTGKDKLFHQERDYILNSILQDNPEVALEVYAPLVEILEKAIR